MKSEEREEKIGGGGEKVVRPAGHYAGTPIKFAVFHREMQIRERIWRFLHPIRRKNGTAI